MQTVGKRCKFRNVDIGAALGIRAGWGGMQRWPWSHVKIERLVWLQNFRRLVVRYERYAENFLGMLHLGCCIILLRHL